MPALAGIDLPLPYSVFRTPYTALIRLSGHPYAEPILKKQLKPL